MNEKISQRLDNLLKAGQETLLKEGLKGLEKESLRISNDGFIAQTPHPSAFGSALTHPYITTDYSEALLEFITPPFPDSRKTFSFLEETHQFVYGNLPNELLLATSMPCGLSGDESIPIANYGTSNSGRMKHIYRVGLAYRYGRAMQAIAGIHFNYSVAQDLWPVLQASEKNTEPLKDFIDDRYFALIRNLQRYGWLILYLFGASPAICKAFLEGRHEFHPHFEEFGRNTFYRPYATSLRMSDIGYKSKNQANLNISFNNLEEYVATLTRAIETPFPPYEAIGVKVGGEHRQLSDHILQIENEYYNTVRPKQIAKSGERPTLALKRRGVRYVEIRSLDLNVFEPNGINLDQLRFIETFVLFCLLQDSPPNDEREKKAIKENLLSAAYQGRDPKLCLIREGRPIALRQWAVEICRAMRGICEILDAGLPDKLHTRNLDMQLEAIYHPELTPSARILAAMRENHESFAEFALRLSKEHEHYFRARPLAEGRARFFHQEAKLSLNKQRQIESQDQIAFDEFLKRYFSQAP